MSDLMPCPFCGGSALRITITDEDEVSNVGGDVICCTKCDACTRVFFGEKEGIEDAWNTRADLAAERERKLVEALKLTVEDLEEWSGCKSALEAAGFNMDDTQVRAEFARATLKELGYE